MTLCIVLPIPFSTERGYWESLGAGWCLSFSFAGTVCIWSVNIRLQMHVRASLHACV